MGDEPGPRQVSIVIPCHNYGRFLGEAIDSALAQTYPGVEVLVIDDGSEDDTAEVAARYVGLVEYRHQSKQGLSRSRNAGAAWCQGEFVAFLDADDHLDPRYVEHCLAALAPAEPDVGYAYTQVHHFGSTEFVTDHPAFDLQKLKVGNYINATALIRSELVRRFGYDPSLPAWEDWSFYLTLAEHGYRGLLVDEPLLHYRRSDTSMAGALAGDPLRKQRLRWEVYKRHRSLYALSFLVSTRLRLARIAAATTYRSWRGRLGVSAPR